VNIDSLQQHGPCEWRIAPRGKMHVPVVIYATEALVRDMDEKVREQAVNVASLPGMVGASCAMPDAHWGYGFPIGGVAAFDAEHGGVVSAGGVGFDVSCGVRCLHTGLTRDDVMPVQRELADALFSRIPAGMGSRGAIHLNHTQMHDMLVGGAKWAVERDWGTAADLERIEEHGQMLHAKPSFVSDMAKKRQCEEMGTLGSGNHYHLDVPEPLRITGQPVLIGGSMGTGSYVMAGTHRSESLAFSSACHGAGRAMSRHEALRHWHGRQVVDELAARGIIVKSASSRGIAEEAPGAYKDVAAVVDVADEAGLARKVARLQPLICVKG
jgi:tRNA-splicing ligase RtcB